MNTFLKCNIQNHEDSKIINICIQQKCIVQSRLCCQYCADIHEGHRITTLNTKLQTSKLNNLKINCRQAANYPQSQSIIHQYMANLLDKCQHLFANVQKFKNRCFTSYLLPINQYISNSFRDNAHQIVAQKIINQQMDNDKLNFLIKMIRSFQKQHLNNIPILQKSVQIMCRQIGAIFDKCFNQVNESLAEAEFAVNKWSLIEVENYKQIVYNFSAMLQSPKKQLPIIEKQFINLVKQKNWKPILQQLSDKNIFLNITKLKLWGYNNPSNEKYQPNVTQNIIKIPNLSLLSNLTYLSMDFNQIKEIEYINSLTNLQQLWLNYNQIKKIEHIQQLKKLTKLGLRYNQIAKIQNLDTLTNLIVLGLDYNQISKIQNLSILINLNKLYLNNNQISKIQNFNTLNALATLEINANRLQNTTENKIQLLKLKKKIADFKVDKI